MDLVGLDAVQQTLDDCGLTSTGVVASCRDQYDALVDDLARGGLSLVQALADPDVLMGFRVLDPATANHST
ncbi:MAG: serine hydrolase, partial [Acidimicrobiales bacterium]